MPDHVDARYARTEEYRKQLAEIQATGVCPFCPDNFKWHPHRVWRNTRYWRLTPIRENYPNAKLHLLIIVNRHVTHISDLLIEEWADLRDLITWACSKHKIDGGGLAMRFGPTEMTGSSVAHLHAHLIVPETNEETDRAIPVSFPFG